MSNSNSMVAHIWAQQRKESARSSNGNFSFSGRYLYSYSTVIASFVQSVEGERVALITSRGYSMTTSSKHMPAARGAVSGKVFYVPNVSPCGIADHTGNLAYLVGEYGGHVAKCRRARDLSDWQLTRLADLAKTAQSYARTFGLAVPEIDAASDAEEVINFRAARDAKNATPQAIAKRAKALAAREAAKERKAELAHLKGAEKIAAWRAGETVHLGWGENRCADGGALLRIKGTNLETSQGATVPMSHAIRVFQFAKLCRDSGQSWERNGRTLRVGHFQVDRVGADGSFAAGCHQIYWPEIEQAAIAAGVAGMAGQDTRDGAAVQS